MDIQVSKFRDTLGLFKTVVPRKPRLEVLTNIMLKDGKAVATDMDTLVAVPLPEADINCLIPYADAVKVLQYVPGDEMLHIEVKDGTITMSWSDGSAEFSVGEKTVDDYPPVPEFAVDAEALVDVDALIPTMDEILVYAATEDSRPVLSGVTLVLGPEQTMVAAGDGFRMAHRVLPLQFPREAVVIVPRDSVDTLKLLWQKTPRTLPAGADSIIPIITAKKYASIAVDVKRTGLRFAFGESATAFVRLIQGNPPDWLKLMPTGEPQMVASVIAPELDLAVRRVQQIAKGGSGIVRLVFNDGTATISARGDGHNAESSIKVMVMSRAEPPKAAAPEPSQTGAEVAAPEGEAPKAAPMNRVGLNSKYLLDYLKGKEGVVTITMTQEGAPVAFRYQKAPTVLIMPMLVQW